MEFLGAETLAWQSLIAVPPDFRVKPSSWWFLSRHSGGLAASESHTLLKTEPVITRAVAGLLRGAAAIWSGERSRVTGASAPSSHRLRLADFMVRSGLALDWHAGSLRL